MQEIAEEQYVQIFILLSKELKMRITVVVLIVLLILGIIFEIIVILPLNYQIYKRNPSLSSGFFIIFLLGCWMDLIYAIVKTCMELTYYQIEYVNITANLSQWYFLYFLTFWNTVLAINRFTALVFVKYYSNLWSKKFIIFVCILLFLYPILVNGYTFFADLHCRLHTYNPECLKFMDKDMNIMSITNTVHAVASFIIGIISYGIIKFYQKAAIITKQAATEQKLLFFSIFSSSFLIIFCGFQVFSASIEDTASFIFWRYLTNILYIIWHYPGLIMLFVLSRAFRHEFCRFYKLDKLLKVKNRVKSNITGMATIL